MSGSQLQAAMVLLLLLQSVQSVYIKYDGFQVKLESVKKLSELEKQQTSEPQLKTSGLLPAVCHDPALPLDLQPVCASQEAASIFKALKTISTDECELCMNVACTGCS
ncbi:Guanylate cyclase activator 2B [Cricetulus griseus]|nr:Guanylate cyclase activator 2B [Cricetulus griseus]